MTNEQAIKMLVALKAVYEEGNESRKELANAFDLAIKALNTEVPQGDLISREALKKTFENACIYGLPMNELYRAILTIIDNAPTVETNEMTQDLIDKVNVNVGLAQPIKNEIPQGEWHYYNNSNVNGYIHDGCKCREEVFDYAYNFCPNCGASMKGGTE